MGFPCFFHGSYFCLCCLLLFGITNFFFFGFSSPVYQSSAPVELTEAETEYAVNVVKHIFDKHVVFQYNCTNTIPEQLLENVSTNFLKW